MDALEQLDELAPLLGALATRLDDDQLDAPTPCSEFTVQGVLEHMIGGGTAFAALFRGETPSEPPSGGSDTLGAFGNAMEGLMAAVHAPGALDRTIPAPFGDVPGDVFARFVVLDGLIHAWDMSVATGLSYDPSDALVADVAAFAHEAITPAMRDAGMFGAPTEAPADASPIERLAAFTGRRIARSSR
jgi:uncharacterized protein (TIGR03086 family)